MFVVIDGVKYRENDIVTYDNSYGHIKGIIKYGEWIQDASGGEYNGCICYGWFVKFIDLVPYEWETDSKDEILEYYPTFEKNQSLLELTKCRGNISNFACL